MRPDLYIAWKTAAIAGVVICLAAAPTGAQAPRTSADSIEGKWSGMAGLPTDRVAIAFEIKRDTL